MRASDDEVVIDLRIIGGEALEFPLYFPGRQTGLIRIPQCLSAVEVHMVELAAELLTKVARANDELRRRVPSFPLAPFGGALASCFGASNEGAKGEVCDGRATP